MTFCALISESPGTPQLEPNELPDDIRAVLPALIHAERARCAPAGIDEVTASLTGTLALLGGAMGQEDRTAWQVAAAIELRDLPADLALEGLKHARRKCDRPSQVLPAVFDYVGDWHLRRRRFLDALIALASAAAISL